jgi:DUF971 family protein
MHLFTVNPKMKKLKIKEVKPQSQRIVYVTTGVSFPEDLYTWAQTNAKEEDRSFSNYLCRLLNAERKRQLQKAA